MKRRCLWLFLVLVLTGCLGGTRPAPLIRQYVPEYLPPRAATGDQAPASLRVERFSASRLYSGTEMIVRRVPFRQESYHEQRWRISPSDMVTDYLRRDLRNAGLFQAVFTPRDREEARFVLVGGLEEFLEVEGASPQDRKALLSVTLTFLDQSRREIHERVVFQKAYRCEAGCSLEGAAGLAEAMSRALSQCSAQAIDDVGMAMKNRR